MTETKNKAALFGIVLASSLTAAALTALLSAWHYEQAFFQILGAVCQKTAEAGPEMEQAVTAALKEIKYGQISAKDMEVILAYGYRSVDFFPLSGVSARFFSFGGFLLSGALFLLVLWFWRGKETERMIALTAYLEKINVGNDFVLFPRGKYAGAQDAGAKLQDEIYKTVTALYQAKEAAVKAKENFAENLSNIAHQMKTPLTAISLSVQLMKNDPSQDCLEQMRQQLSRLTHLEEALLLLSRIDAGALRLNRQAVDVYTLLMLAADNLQELFAQAGVGVCVLQEEEMTIDADLDWTMEAIMNLFKNCMEHTPPGGTVHGSYERNPLYVQIRIWDDGPGFAEEDFPHLFERFYRGQRIAGSGIGIGLALSKAMIESQNGTVRACNRVEGGACFEIRFYRR